MPKVTKIKVNETDTPKRNSKNNQSIEDEEDQPVVTIVDKTDESNSKKGVKRKASASVEKVKNFTYEIVFSSND
jgi:hypothetical protein